MGPRPRLAGPAPAAMLRFSAEQFAELIRTSDLVAEEIGALARKRNLTEALTVALPGLDGATLAALLPEFTLERRAPGEVVLRQGDPPDGFYLIQWGRARVIVDGTLVNELGEGSFFGRIGLLLETPRTATVVAAAGEEPLVSTRAPLDLLERRHRNCRLWRDLAGARSEVRDLTWGGRHTQRGEPCDGKEADVART